MNSIKLLRIPADVDNDIRGYINKISPDSKVEVIFDKTEILTRDIVFIWDSLSVCGEVIKIIESTPDASIIILTNDGNQKRAEDVISYGAIDYRMLPISKEIFEIYLRKSKINSNIAQEAMEVTKSIENIFFTKDAKTQQLLKKAALISKSNASVLIIGESGTGKERMSKYIHECSDRSDKRMIAVNCAAIPEAMIESELFGYVKGAFTGAVGDKMGKFELANNSTILLDEITEMPIDLQAKLLRVIQEGEIDRLGSVSTKKINVRIIATSNRNIEQAVADGKFREDLFYRLSVVSISIPPLRKRKDDILFLAKYFLQQYSDEYSKPMPDILPEAISDLSQHIWRGNVRELENCMHRAILTCDGKIAPSDLDIDVSKIQTNITSKQASAPVIMSIRDMEKALIEETLKKVEGNRTEAAKLLGINIKTLRAKIKTIATPV